MSDGLDALLGLNEESTEVTAGSTGASDGTAALETVAVDAIRPNEFQPRERFAEADLAALSASISELGVLQPVLLRRIDDGQYELVAGERRWRAARLAGLRVIPAIVRDIDDLASLEQAVVENLHRSDLNPLEEAAAYRQLMDDFGLTQEMVARRVGKSRSAVANLLRLFQLPSSIQRLIASEQLTAGHARALLAFPDGRIQEELAARVVREGLSVRAVEDLVRAASQRGSETDLGSGPGRGSVKPAGLLEIERTLSDRLDTNVEVSVKGQRGRVVIEFADAEDLDRLFRMLS